MGCKFKQRNPGDSDLCSTGADTMDKSKSASIFCKTYLHKQRVSSHPHCRLVNVDCEFLDIVRAPPPHTHISYTTLSFTPVHSVAAKSLFFTPAQPFLYLSFYPFYLKFDCHTCK